MAQQLPSDYPIDPTVTSGTALADILNRTNEVLNSNNSGATRPSTVKAGGLWTKTGGAALELYLFNGTTDVFYSAIGPAGPQGPAGANSTVPGPTGPTGPQGPTGPAPDTSQFVKKAGDTMSGQLTINSNLIVTGNAGIKRPSNFWQGSDYYSVSGFGSFATQGSNAVAITSNGYRNNVGTWTSLGAGGQSGAAQIESLPSGIIAFRTQASKATGTNYVIDEAMRIDSGKNLLFAQTSTATPGLNNTTVGIALERTGPAILISRATGSCLFVNTNENSAIITMRRSGVGVGTIAVSTTGTTYNTSSDYRLKENLVPISNALTRILAVPVYRFNFIADPTKTVDGFVAHELAEHLPEAVTGTKDEMQAAEYQDKPALGDVFIPAVEAVLDDEGNVVTEAAAEEIISINVEQPEVLINNQEWRQTSAVVISTRQIPAYQGVDQSKITPLLTAAIQELSAKLDALQAEVDALKGVAP